MNQIYRQETPELKEAVTATALDYCLLSKYTAFVAVSEDVRVNPEKTIPQRIQISWLKTRFQCRHYFLQRLTP
jgi:Ca-activated chloride channel family protein